MNAKSFVNKLNQITRALLLMTPAQREVVHQSIQALDSEITMDELVQPLFDALSQCPHCHSHQIRKWGKSGSTQRYHCKECRKTFNNKTKTPLAKLRKSHLWDKYIHCMVLKLTLREAAAICGINLKTAFLWRHRFLIAQAGKNHDKLSGIIEVDEFFLAYSEKGSKTLVDTKIARKRGGNIDKRTKEGQVPVLLSIDRSNHMITPILSADTTAEIVANFAANITENSVLCSDGSRAYVTVAKQKSCDHKRLINNKVRVLDSVYHIQTVNGAIAHFKGWVNVKMRGVATKYLSHYLAWFRESNAKLNEQKILEAAYR